MRPTIAVYPGIYSSKRKNISLEQAHGQPLLVPLPRSHLIPAAPGSQVPMAVAVIARAASYVPQVVPHVFSEFNLNINLFNIYLN